MSAVILMGITLVAGVGGSSLCYRMGYRTALDDLYRGKRSRIGDHFKRYKKL